MIKYLQDLSDRFGFTSAINQVGRNQKSFSVPPIDKYVAPERVALPKSIPENELLQGQAGFQLIWGPIADLARLAPTPHNTQPFRIEPLSETEANILLLPERLLPEEDHGNRYMMMSSGVFAEAMEIAGRSRGLILEITALVTIDPERLADGRPPVVVAQARIIGRCDPQMEPITPLQKRSTSRLRYHDRVVPESVLKNLSVIASDEGQRFLHYDDPKVVDTVLRQNARSVIDNLQIQNETREVEGWMRYGKTPPHGDGLWELPFGQKKWMTVLAFRFPWLYNLPLMRGISMWVFRRTMAGTRHIGLLCGKFDKTSDLFATGKMFMRFWLEMQRHNVVMHPMGSMLTNPSHNAQIAEYFKVSDCWLAFRFGYSDEPPRAPRLASVLLLGKPESR